MILHSLAQLYDRLSDDPEYELTPRGYSPQKIGFKIILKSDGSLFDIQDARQAQEKGKPLALTQKVIGIAKPSGAGINPCFLWDNSSYTLGFKPDDDKPERTAKAFEAFKEKHIDLMQTLDSPDYQVVCKFLKSWTPEKAQDFLTEKTDLHEAFTNFGVFYIQGKLEPVHQDPEIKTWWESQAEEGTTIGQCLISGEQDVALARLHPKIKSVAGAQSAGANIVSFNEDAYESYGMKQSFNAPTSEKVAFKYGTALNNLLTGPKSSKHRIRIGDTTCVFWTDKPSVVEDVFNSLFSEGSNVIDEVQDENQRSKIEQVLKAIQSGSNAEMENGDKDDTKFFILGLAPNAARLSVRFFHESTVTELLSKLHQHLHDISIVKEFEQPMGKRKADPDLPANWLLLSQTARESKEIPPLLGGALMRAILQGTNYPESLYTAVLRRIKADRTINYLRACIIKGVLTRNHQLPIPNMLDSEHPEPSYHLGRLFALLEKAQFDALGDLNSGIRDKYYSSASATPASVYPRILRTLPHHLAKLNKPSEIFLERKIQEVMSHFDEFPNQLNLKQQGIFSIGYYHQRKNLFTKKETTQTTESN